MITDMEVLIAELETAPEGDEQLDRRLALALGWMMELDLPHDRWSPPPYTRSLSVAWAQIPAEFGVTLHRFLEPGRPVAGQPRIWQRSWATIHSHYPEGTPRPVGTIARPEWTCSANTEALALCAAVLKSRLDETSVVKQAEIAFTTEDGS